MPKRNIRAVCRTDGILELLEPVEFPKDEPMTVIVEFPEPHGSAESRRSLRGRFPELRNLTDKDFEEAKQQLEEGALKQMEHIKQP